MLSVDQKHAMADNAVKAEAMMKLLANQYRLRVLCALVDGEKSVSELEAIVGLSQSALSQHLAKLRSADVVITEKRGQMVLYKLASVEVNAILSTLYLIYCR
ncbi:ArsR/SmtB family transcription factor [Alteromonas oceanisediminis]|uniref:ArsR/SmtB family transcription factor n=1 Tax=Alteromonas oceanisediminis TaxID=2836180 RepID=UPI001BDA87AB|nr:metalloregulator ArsR/SmtB family transcription factor [Alteromonas oceanisediminis]MBT0585573.1 winged helix-turn-helix domain-containing protein [Alteromonas oceanisediminis]